MQTFVTHSSYSCQEANNPVYLFVHYQTYKKWWNIKNYVLFNRSSNVLLLIISTREMCSVYTIFLNFLSSTSAKLDVHHLTRILKTMLLLMLHHENDRQYNSVGTPKEWGPHSAWSNYFARNCNWQEYTYN
jgi:hypothetical protein